MGLVLEFDPTNSILRGTMNGQLTDAVLLDYYATAARCAQSHSPCRGLWDVSGVTEFEASGHALRQVAGLPPIIPTGYMRVIVAPRDFLFGMMRMLQILGEESRPELHVVRTMGEAYHLLGVESPEFSPVS